MMCLECNKNKKEVVYTRCGHFLLCKKCFFAYKQSVFSKGQKIECQKCTQEVGDKWVYAKLD